MAGEVPPVQKGAHYRIKSLEKVVRLLDCLAASEQPLGVADLVAASHIPKATVHRLISAMASSGLVFQEAERGRYSLGYKLIELGVAAENSSASAGLIKSALTELSRITGETLHMAILSDGLVRYVAKAESDSALRMPSRVGGTNRAHCTAVGKVLLATLNDQDLEHVVSQHGLPRRTRRTIVSPEDLAQELSMIRKNGFAVDDEELEVGLRCVAVPVSDGDGNVFAAVSISGPSSRVTPGRDAEVVSVLQGGAKKLGSLESGLFNVIS